MTTVRAGQHGDPTQAHADTGADGLWRHLFAHHEHYIDRRLGAAVAQHTHRTMHEETTE